MATSYLKQSSKAEQRWILEPEGYTEPSDKFKYKSRIVDRTVTDEDGTKRQIREKVIEYRSRSHYARERHQNQSFLEFIEKLKANPNGFKVTASQSKKLKKFLKKDMLNKKRGLVPRDEGHAGKPPHLCPYAGAHPGASDDLLHGSDHNAGDAA